MPRFFHHEVQALAYRKGEVVSRDDGYCGQWSEGDEQANPADFKKVETPEGKTSTMVVRRTATGFAWYCLECQREEVTTIFKRPVHTCQFN